MGSREGRATDAARWCVRSGALRSGATTLLCFAHAGGSVGLFRGWSAQLPDSLDVVGVELPGHGTRIRETPFTDLRALVTAAVDAIEPTLHGPFALFGFSMGALLAFEFARELRRRGALAPSHLFVAAHRAPTIPYPAPHAHRLSDEAFLARIARLGGMPPELLHDRDVLSVMLPVFRADATVLETYAFEPGPLLACPLSVFGGHLDPDVRPEHLGAWSEHTTGAFVPRTLPGDHFFVRSSADLLLRAVASDLQTTVARTE